jgi:serine/threonine protein kinase
MKNYILSQGNNNTVIALSKTEAAKLYLSDTRTEIGAEARKMQFANTINDLVVQFIRLDFSEELQAELLVMERLQLLDFRTAEREIRQLWLEVFEHKLLQLHKVGFVHRGLSRDLQRPSNVGGEKYDNIILTAEGLRLIDVGISAIKSEVGDKIFGHYVHQELKELEIFKGYFMGR